MSGEVGKDEWRWDPGFGKGFEDQVWVFLMSSLSDVFGCIFYDDAGDVKLEVKVLDYEIDFPGAGNRGRKLEVCVGVICVIPPLFKGRIEARCCQNLLPSPMDLKGFEVHGEALLGLGVDLSFDILQAFKL